MESLMRTLCLHDPDKLSHASFKFRLPIDAAINDQVLNALRNQPERSGFDEPPTSNEE